MNRKGISTLQRYDAFNQDLVDKAEVFLESHGWSNKSENTLKLIDEYKAQQRDFLECGLFDERWEQEQINDNISWADTAYDYVYSLTYPDFSATSFRE